MCIVWLGRLLGAIKTICCCYGWLCTPLLLESQPVSKQASFNHKMLEYLLTYQMVNVFLVM